MIDALLSFADISVGLFWHGVAVFLRVASAVSLAPGFGETVVPIRIKLAVSIMLTLPVASIVPPFFDAGTSDAVIRAILTETMSGVLLGVSLRLFVHGLQTTGAIAAQSTSLSQVFASAGADPQPAIGHVLVLGALALAMILGFHTKLVAFLVLSYQIFPPLAFPVPSVVGEWGVALVTHVFSLGLMLAMPFVIVSVLYNLALGAINRAMPQLMVAFVGAPAITFGSLLLLFLLAPAMLLVWVSALDAFLINPSEPMR